MSPFFKRNDKTTIAELEEYYATQKPRRTGMAWFMALLSLLITVAVIVALFFGGRWLYRTFVTNDNGGATVSDNGPSVNDVQLPSFDGDLPEQEAPDTDERGVETDGVVSDEAARTTRTPGSESDSALGVSELPNTGAGFAIAIVPASAGIAGYIVSRRKQLK